MIALPPGFASEAEVRTSPQAQAFLAGQPIPPMPRAAPSAPLQIRPLTALASPAPTPPASGGLRIRPLDAFLVDLPSLMAGGTPGGTPGVPAPNQPELYYTPQPVPDPRVPQGTPIPADVRAAMQGTAWADATGRMRMFWDTQSEGNSAAFGPNTDIITGVENGQYTFARHPLWPVGSPAYDALVARARAEGWNERVPGPGGLGAVSDTFTADPNFQGMTTAELAARFGHLAGPSPLMAALDVNPFGTGLPASNLLGPLFAAAPGPGFLVGPVMRFMEQAAINDAMRDPEGFRSFVEANPIGLGFPGGGGNDEGSVSNAPNFGGDLFHAGGAVGEGPPKGPNRKATLQEGEYVVKKAAAAKHRPLLDAINRGESPKKLAKLIAYLEAE